MIGGSGLYSLDEVPGWRPAGAGRGGQTAPSGTSPWGPPSEPVTTGVISGTPVAFIPRHGRDHSIPPHRINYRANIEALRSAGVKRVLAVCTVGGIGAGCEPGTLVIPEQLIDYTWGRENTFAGPDDLEHIDFTDPYTPGWREEVVRQAEELAPAAEVPLVAGGVYGATQGPRFETAAEIARLSRDGCAVVGMTGMPEAILAREAGLEYAAVCPVGNLAAGISPVALDQHEVTVAAGTALPLVTELIAALA